MPADGDEPVSLEALGLSGGGAQAPPKEDPKEDPSSYLDDPAPPKGQPTKKRKAHPPSSSGDSDDGSFGADLMGSDSDEDTDSDSEGEAGEAGEADLPEGPPGTKKRTAEPPAENESSDEDDPEPEVAATPGTPKKKRPKLKADAAGSSANTGCGGTGAATDARSPAEEPKTGARVVKEGKTSYRLVRPGTADFRGNKTAVRNLLRGSASWTRFSDTDHGVEGIELLAISRNSKAAPSPAPEDTSAGGAAPPPTASEKPAGTLAATNVPPGNKDLKDMSLAEVKAYIRTLVAKRPSEEDQRRLLVRGANEDRIHEPFRGQLKAATAELEAANGPEFLPQKLAELDAARKAAARAQSAALTGATAHGIQAVATTFAAYSKLVKELEGMDVPAARLCNLANADEISLSSYADSLLAPDCSAAVREATEALAFVRRLCVDLEAIVNA